MSSTASTEPDRDTVPSKLSRRRFLLGSGAIGGTIASGAGYQALGTNQDRSRYPPPGELVDIGTHRIHLNFIGHEHHGPTVVLEAGAGDFSLVGTDSRNELPNSLLSSAPTEQD